MENKMDNQTVTMAHGAGGKQTSELIDKVFAAHFANPDLTADEVCFPPAPCAIVTVWLSIFSLILFPLFLSLFTVTISIFFYTPYMK